MQNVKIAGPVSVFAGGILLLSWWLPNHFFPWMSFYNEFLAFIALLLLLGHAFLSGNHFRFSLLSLTLLAVATVPWLQYGGGLLPFRGDALIASLYLAAAGAAVLVGRSYTRPRNLITVLAALLVMAALVSTVLALMQWLSVGNSVWVADLRSGGRPHANLGQPNNLATLLCMGFAGLLYLWERRILGWGVATLIGALLLFALALTQSRTPWVISLVFVVWCLWQHRRGALRLAPLWPLLWLGLYVALILCLPYLAEGLDTRASDAISRAQRTGRLDLWQQMWHAITQGGFWGYGWNQVATAQLAAALDYQVPIQTEHSHNIVLDILIWNGPVLGAIILVLTGGWLLRLYLRTRSLESSFCLMAVAALLVHSLLEYPLEYAYFLLPACVLLGLVESDQQAPTLGGGPSWVALPVLLAGVLATTLVWIEYRYLEEDFRLMRYETARIGDPAAAAAPPAHPSLWQFTQVREYIRYARTPAKEGMTQAELDWMQKVSSRFPHPPSLVRYGLALAINGQPEEAHRVILRLRGVHGEKHYLEARDSLRALSEIHPQLNMLVLP